MNTRGLQSGSRPAPAALAKSTALRPQCFSAAGKAGGGRKCGAGGGGWARRREAVLQSPGFCQESTRNSGPPAHGFGGRGAAGPVGARPRRASGGRKPDRGALHTQVRRDRFGEGKGGRASSIDIFGRRCPGLAQPGLALLQAAARLEESPHPAPQASRRAIHGGAAWRRPEPETWLRHSWGDTLCARGFRESRGPARVSREVGVERGSNSKQGRKPG